MYLHVDYLGGHGDFLRLIFVRGMEKLYWLTNFGISLVILYTCIYFIHVYTVNKVICRSFFRELNSKLQ